nr:uncharacterized protein LOC111421719 [Onthophagus taurus]
MGRSGICALCTGSSRHATTIPIRAAPPWVTRIQEVAPDCVFIHCSIHRQALAAKEMPDELRFVLNDAVKVVNFIKARALNPRLFRILCSEIGEFPANLNAADQEKLIELSYDGELKMEFKVSDLGEFWTRRVSEYPSLAKQALKYLMPFSTRLQTNEDLFKRLLLSSDPFISNFYKECSERYKNMNEDMKNLLILDKSLEEKEGKEEDDDDEESEEEDNNDEETSKHRNFTNLSIRREKKAYLEHMLSTRGCRELWTGFRAMGIVNSKQRSIPDFLASVDAINDYFQTSQIVATGDMDTINYYNLNIVPGVTEKLTLTLATKEEIYDVLLNLKSNAIGTDGIGIKMLLLCCPLILPYICHIINYCIQGSVFPDCWKTALITPIPKSSNPSQLKDLRPISILPVISKILEKIIADRLREHLDKFNILPMRQSGFRKGYSCTAALLDVTDDIVREIDQKNVTILILLDYSKAFDTVHHKTLLSMLHYIGLSDDSILFFCNYLTGRKQMVALNGNFSTECAVSSGVPQGSVLGPILYLIYTCNLYNVLRSCKAHMYADDTQLYYSFNINDLADAQNCINSDLTRLVEESSKLCLQLNPDKSSVMVFGGRRAVGEVKASVDLKLNGVKLNITDESRNLGITIDSTLRFLKHVASLLHPAYTTLKLLCGNRQLLNQRLRA